MSSSIVPKLPVILVLAFAFASYVDTASADSGQKIGQCPSDPSISIAFVAPKPVMAIDPSATDINSVASWVAALTVASPQPGIQLSTTWLHGDFDPSKAALTYSMSTFLTGGSTSGPTMIPAPTTEVATPQSVVFDGLAGFVQARVQAELQEAVVDHVLQSLCNGNDTAGYFPKTCSLAATRDRSYLDLSHSYSALVMALRADVNNLGGCALYIRQHSYLGYRIQSIFHQNEQGTSLDQLLFGLVTSGDLNVTEKQTPDASDGTLLADPGNREGGAACTASAVNDIGADGKTLTSTHMQFSGMCDLVVPLIAYVATLEAKASIPPTNAATADKQKFVSAFGLAFASLIARNKVCDASVPTNCPLADEITTTLSDVLKAADRLDVATQKLNTIYGLSDDISRRLGQLSQNSANRTDVAEAIVAIGDDSLAQFSLALNVGMISQSDQRQIVKSVDVLKSLYGAYTAFEAKEYVAGVDNLTVAISCFDDAGAACGLPVTDTDTKPHVESLSTAVSQFITVGGAVASLAEAKSSDDFTNTLTALASPVDTWKIRHQENLSTIQAFGGFRVWGREANNVPGYGSVTSADYGEVIAPIGYAGSCNDCVAHLIVWNPHMGTWGYFVSLIDVGNVLDQPHDVSFGSGTTGGTIRGSVENKFSNIIEPGLYLFWAPSDTWPIVIGANYTFGPPDYRTVNYQDGHTDLASRHYAWGLFIAFDIPIVILN